VSGCFAQGPDGSPTYGTTTWTGNVDMIDGSTIRAYGVQRHAG